MRNGSHTTLCENDRGQIAVKRWPNHEGSSAHLVGLERNNLLFVASIWSNTKFDLCSQQLDNLKLALDRKRPELASRTDLVFHQDNARPYTSIMTRQKLQEFR
ncbi:hypothetical protein TNCV_87571 [Trichonephila clavipes]|nr:hypothetical protein TNCV_87571 [Trichonephila clavipes]